MEVSSVVGRREHCGTQNVLGNVTSQKAPHYSLK